MDAFHGLLSKFPYHTAWGVPIACTLDEKCFGDSTYYDIGFARGLWWEKQEKEGTRLWLRRISNFPSWSWTGWAGAVLPQYPDEISDYELDSQCNYVCKDAFDTNFLLELENGQRISPKDFCESSTDTNLEAKPVEPFVLFLISC